MNENIKNWIKKADNDLKIAKDEIITTNPATDMICFHSQQSCEKYLKCFLIYNNKEIKKTHNISELIMECKKIDSEFQKLFDNNIDKLTDYAIEIRYPEDIYFPDLDEANEAIALAEEVREFVLKKLKIKDFNI